MSEILLITRYPLNLILRLGLNNITIVIVFLGLRSFKVHLQIIIKTHLVALVALDYFLPKIINLVKRREFQVYH